MVQVSSRGSGPCSSSTSASSADSNSRPPAPLIATTRWRGNPVSPARGGPASRLVVEAARQVAPGLEEVDHPRLLLAKAERVDPVTVRVGLGGDAHAEARQPR